MQLLSSVRWNSHIDAHWPNFLTAEGNAANRLGCGQIAIQKCRRKFTDGDVIKAVT